LASSTVQAGFDELIDRARALVVGADEPADAPLVLIFGQDGTSDPYRLAGWSTREPDLIWTVGARSQLRLPAHDAGCALFLDMVVNPCIRPPVTTSQLLRLVVNGVPLGSCLLSEWSRVSCEIPADILRPGEPIDIEFVHPGFVNVDMLAHNGDQRPLAIAVYALRLGYTPWQPDRGGLLGRYADLRRCHLVPSPPRPTVDAVASFRVFYRLGAAPEGMLQDGWMVDEEGQAWTASTNASRLKLPAPPLPGPYRLTIALAPLRIRNVRGNQLLSIVAAGHVLGQFVLEGETILSVPLPEELITQGGELDLVLLTPGAVRLNEFAAGRDAPALGFIVDSIAIERLPPELHSLAVLRSDDPLVANPASRSAQFLDLPLPELETAILAETGKTAAELMVGFESLGDNCGFGLAQRKAGVEVLNLLRFANTPLVALARGLEDQFGAARRRDEITLALNIVGDPREFMLSIACYGIRWHTMLYETDATLEDIREPQMAKLVYLQRRFLEGLRTGRKTYVLIRSEPRKVPVVAPFYGDAGGYEEPVAPLSVAEILPIFIEMNRTGHNSLMYVVPSAPGKPSGMVEWVAPGLMRGYIGSLYISADADQRDHVEWLRVTANAYLLRNKIAS
jgi:hypothetical protein